MLALIVGAWMLAGCAEGRAGAAPLSFDGTLAQQAFNTAGPERPIPLRPNAVNDLRLEVTNTSSEPVTLAHVRLEGSLLALIFLTYDTGIHETLAPGEQRIITFPLDFFDLHGQTHGLLRAHVRLYGPDREPLGSRSLVVDGRGGPWATTVTFTLVLAGIAAASMSWNLLRLSRRRLPASAVARGIRFLHSGLALGLALSAASSVLRIWPFGTFGWLAVTAILSAAAFTFGFLSPGADPAAPAGPGDPVIDLTEPEPVPASASALAGAGPAVDLDADAMVGAPPISPPLRPPVRLGPTGGNVTHGGTVYPGGRAPGPPVRPGGVLEP